MFQSILKPQDSVLLFFEFCCRKCTSEGKAFTQYWQDVLDIHPSGETGSMQECTENAVYNNAWFVFSNNFMDVAGVIQGKHLPHCQTECCGKARDCIRCAQMKEQAACLASSAFCFIESTTLYVKVLSCLLGLQFRRAVLTFFGNIKLWMSNT